MLRPERIERPIRAHQHADVSVLADHDGKIAGFEPGLSRSRSLEDSFGVLKETGHEILIGVKNSIISQRRKDAKKTKRIFLCVFAPLRDTLFSL